MTTYRYEFRNLLTKEKLDVLPLYGVNMSWQLRTKDNATYGDFVGSVRSDTAGRTVSDILGSTIPGKTEVWCYADNAPIWGGIIWSRTYASQGGGTYQFYAQTHDSYAAKFIYTADRSWTTDARNIIRNVWADMVAAGAAWDIGVILPSAIVSGLTNITKAIVGDEQVVAAEVVDAMIDMGAEYRMNYYVDPIGGLNTPRATFELARWDSASGVAPVGIPAGIASPDITYPGAISNYWITESATKGATDIYAIGKGADALTPRSHITNTPLIVDGYPGLGVKLNFRDTETQALLDDRVTKSLPAYALPVLSPSIKLARTHGFQFGAFNLGDYIYAIIRDPYRFVEPFKAYYRVTSMSLSPAGENGTGDTFDFTIAQPSTLIGEG